MQSQSSRPPLSRPVAPGCPPPTSGQPQSRTQRGCCRARSVPHVVSPSQDVLGTGSPLSPAQREYQTAVATLTGRTGCPGGPSPSPRGALSAGVTPSRRCHEPGGPWGQLPKWPQAGAVRPLFPNTIYPQVQFNFPRGRWPAPRTPSHLPTPSVLAPSSLAPLPFASSAPGRAFLHRHPLSTLRSSHKITGGFSERQLIFNYN